MRAWGLISEREADEPGRVDAPVRDRGRGGVLHVEERDRELCADQPAHSVQPECLHPKLDQAAQTAVNPEVSCVSKKGIASWTPSSARTP